MIFSRGRNRKIIPDVVSPVSWKRTFISSFIAQILGILGFSFAMPFLPFFVAELGVEDVGQQALWAGLVLSSAGLTFALFAPIWGVLADKYGRKLMVCRAMFGGALTMVLMSFSQTVPQLIAFRLFHGVFSGTLAASIALVASVVPQHRSGLTLGMMQTAVFIGNAIGPFFGGLAADAFGYRMSFRIGAVLTLLGGMFVLFGTHERFARPDRTVPSDAPGFKAIFLLPGFAVSVLVMFGVRFSNSVANPSFPLIVRDFLAVPTRLNSITGSVMAVTAVAAAVSSALLGHAGDRVGRRGVLIACCVGACFASAGHYFAQSLPVLFAVRVLFGFSVAGMLPAANSMIHSVVDTRSVGKAFGLATSISMLGMAFGPTVGGYLAMGAGLRFPFLATAVGQIVLAAVVYFFVRDRIAPPREAAV